MTPQPTRARELGIAPGPLPTGPRNAITDVPGVLVGQTTLHEDPDLRTGVTAVVPEPVTGAAASGAADSRTADTGTADTGTVGAGTTDARTAGSAVGFRAVPAAVHVANGHGKLVGSTQVDELGVLESPIVLTATLSVFRAADAVLTYLMERHPDRLSFNPVVGETNDGRISDIRRRPITERHVLDALTKAGRTVTEGCAGAGTGTTALGYKGGIGTSSRVVATGAETVRVGALVQSNFGGTLTVLGVPMPAEELLRDRAQGASGPAEEAEPPGNSCMIVVATDAPLDSRRLGRLARRAVFAMARVGASFSSGSGDYALAFSTAAPERPLLDDHALDPLFAGVMDATEEALLNSLFAATTTVGVHGHVAHAVPHEAVVRRLAERRLLPP